MFILPAKHLSVIAVTYAFPASDGVNLVIPSVSLNTAGTYCKPQECGCMGSMNVVLANVVLASAGSSPVSSGEGRRSGA